MEGQAMLTVNCLSMMTDKHPDLISRRPAVFLHGSWMIDLRISSRLHSQITQTVDSYF